MYMQVCVHSCHVSPCLCVRCVCVLKRVLFKHLPDNARVRISMDKLSTQWSVVVVGGDSCCCVFFGAVLIYLLPVVWESRGYVSNLRRAPLLWEQKEKDSLWARWQHKYNTIIVLHSGSILWSISWGKRNCTLMIRHVGSAKLNSILFYFIFGHYSHLFLMWTPPKLFPM